MTHFNVVGILIYRGSIEMKIWNIQKKQTLFSMFCLLMLVFLVVTPLPGSADDPTLVQVSPVSNTVSAGQTFTINIMCTPGQSIKSYELKLSFNPTLLQANSVTEGTIFTGFTTFFNPGVINNTAGTIVNVYGLIVGAGVVSDPGTLVSLSFTAQAASGTTTIGLFDAGVTNETAYVPITVTNGTVILREYTLSLTLDGSGSVTRNPNQATYPYGTSVQLTAVPDTGWVFTSWSGDVSGSTNPVSLTMNANKSVTAHFSATTYTLTIMTDGSGSVNKNPDQPSYTYGQVVTLTALPAAGWMFSAWTGDLTGNQNPRTITMNANKLLTAHFSDAMAPEISSISLVSSDPVDTDPSYGWVNVSGTITDNVGVSQVLLQIRTPDNSWTNVSMTLRSAGLYYYRSATAFSTAGNYSYTIWARDAQNNANASDPLLFSLPSNWDIDQDGSCMIFDLVLVSNQYGHSGGNGWIREDADNNGEIEVLDLVFISNHFGESWWV